MITAELSLYPLDKDYEPHILGFIAALKANSEVEVHTHSMSTFVKGDDKMVFDAISSAFAKVSSSSDTLSLVIKAINRDLPVEKGFLNLP